ncbi:MltR family transcriptional regulator [Vibrio sp. HA2012]|uniref:MltR family transcriptional regulator n=1 Tax=Vibrio sp. HA2012 TaxID=1971595 RepID=UPI000C2C4BFE|nr:MltR family transcriptional regulator [Vibrio sp. HA2012]
MQINSESDIIEELNSALTVRSFFNIVVRRITQSIDALIQRIFRKDELTVTTVVDSLLNKSGPLGELSDQLKLLFGIGIVPEGIYHNIEDIIRLQKNLNNDINEHTFTDDYVIYSLKEMSFFSRLGLPSSFDSFTLDDDISDELRQLQMQRQQQIIKSGLSLVIVDICEHLDNCCIQ